MKKTITIIFLSILWLSGFSQAKKQYESKTITVILTEQQMIKVYNLFNLGKSVLFDSDQMTAKQAKELSIFADSLNNVFVLQSQKWHPVKSDSTGKK